MSRIGRSPIPVPSNVTVTLDGNAVSVKGPQGQLDRELPAGISITQEGEVLVVTRPDDERRHRALHGLSRSLVANMVHGVTEGYVKTLELVGVGYRAAMKGQALSMQLGLSHDVDIPPPEGVTFATPRPVEIKISGIDKQVVGETAARIRRIRPPEPYKGKGVRYAGEKVRRKEGKKK